MEKSYFCSEQIGQMQATYDALVMLKMTHDAGCDIVNEPINYYCYDWGDQYPIFITCIKRAFSDVRKTYEGLNQHWEEVSTYRISFPEMALFFAIVDKEKSDHYAAKFNKMLKKECDYLEFNMDGLVASSCIHITLTGFYGILSPFLKVLLNIRQEVQQVIRDYINRMQNGARNVLLLKQVHERFGSVPDVGIGEKTDIVFAKIMEYLHADLIMETKDALTFDMMLTRLTHVLNQETINRKDEVA